MIIKAACASSVGKIREKNEDNFYFNGRYMPQDNNGLGCTIATNFSSDGCVFAVYDGMGGHEAGEVASYTAASNTSDYIKECSRLSAVQSLKQLTARLNEAVYREGGDSSSFMHMGTTEVMLKFHGDLVYVCNVGDSPAFRLRGDEFKQISTDHVEKLPKGAMHKPRLTQCLGMDPEEIMIEPYVAKGDLKKGDQYLLCSDGLTDMVSNEEISSVLKNSVSIKKAVDSLMKKALDNGGKDNITILLCRVK